MDYMTVMELKSIATTYVYNRFSCFVIVWVLYTLDLPAFLGKVLTGIDNDILAFLGYVKTVVTQKNC